MEDQLKEVYFDQYCKTCEHWPVPEVQDPCNQCLSVPANYNSHKPVMYVEKSR